MINYTKVTKLLKTESKRWIRRVHQLPVESCKGHILAENIEAPENYPAFDKSAMDGFAIAEEGLSELPDLSPHILVTETLRAPERPVPLLFCFFVFALHLSL